MRRNALARAVHHKRSLKQVWQLGDVTGDAPRFIERQRFGGSGITLIGVAVDIGESLTIGVHDLEAAAV